MKYQLLLERSDIQRYVTTFPLRIGIRLTIREAICSDQLNI